MLKKRIVSLLLVVCMVAVMLPVGVAAEGVYIGDMIQSYTNWFAYTGEPIDLDIDWRSEDNLVEDTDYTIQFKDSEGTPVAGTPFAVGDYTVIITGIEPNYSGDHTIEITIDGLRNLSSAIIYYEPDYLFTGLPVVLDIEAVKIGGATLTRDTDYTISYTDNDSIELDGAPTEIGDYYAVFTGVNSYSGEKREPFSIVPATSLMFAEISMDWFYTYTGEPVVITGLTVTLGDKTLIENTDYEIKYFDQNLVELSPPPSDIGHYQLSFIGKGDYSGTYGGFLLILPPNNLMLAEVSMTDTYEYTGSPVVISDLVVTLGGNTLTQGVDYTVSYEDEDGYEISDPTEVGEYYVIVEGIEPSYTEYAYLMFTITENTAPITNWTDYVKTKPLGYDEDGGGNITISTAEGLAWLSSVANGQEGNSFSGKTVTLTADIDLSAYNWTPIKDFAGTFEGGGHSINNMTVTNTACAGLFGFLHGTVQNLSVSGSVSSGGGYNYAGGIAGYNTETGNIINCKYQGEISGTDSIVYAGGLVGLNKGAVKNCYNTGTVTAISSYDNYAGGLAGYNRDNGTVINCYNTGAVTASGDHYNYAGGLVGFNTNTCTVTNCYNTGAVTASSGTVRYAGGLIGRHDAGTMTNCYWLDTAAGAATGSGLGTAANCVSFTKVQGKGTEETFAYKIGANTKTGTLCDALNAWVEAQAIPNDYFDWINTSAADYPLLYPLGVPYTVSFNPNGGTVSAESLTVTSGDLYGALPTPTRAGYAFNGWYTETNGGTKISETDRVILTADQTLYARWIANEGTDYIIEHYQQTISGNSYVLAETENRTGTTDSEATATAQTYTGFTENMSHLQRTASGVISSDGSLVLKLYYDRNVYTVSFVSNGGTAVSELSPRYEAKITKPADPSRAGYHFSGWYKDEVLALAWDFQTDVVTSNMTLYAKWAVVSSPSSSDNDSSSVTAATPLPTAEQPTPPTVGTIKPSVTVDGGGRVSVTVTEQDVKNAISTALALAKSGGTATNGIAVSIDLSALQAQFSTFPLTLSKGAYQALADAGVRSLDIKTPQISLSLDLQTLKTILQNMGDQITITAERIDPASLTGAARTALGSRPAYRLSIAYGDKKITSFGGGWVSLFLPYAPANGENPAGLCAVYADGTGGVQWLWNSSYNQNARTLLLRTSHFSTFGIGYKQVPSFTDIAGHWAKSDIEYVAVRGLMNGTSATAFSPESGMTRGMFVTALGRLAGVDSTKYKDTKFTDVKADAYYAPYVAWASEKGITSDTSATTFSPDKLISRQEMAVLLANYAKATGCTLPKTREAITFADAASIGSFARDAVKAMQMAGVINGKNSNKFDPQGTATRAEAAATLHRYAELVIDIQTAQGLDINDSGRAPSCMKTESR